MILWYLPGGRTDAKSWLAAQRRRRRQFQFIGWLDGASTQRQRSRLVNERASVVSTQSSGSAGRRASCGHRERRIRPPAGRRASSSHPGPAPLRRRINTLSACEPRCVGGMDSTEVERGRRPGAPAARNYPRLPASNLRSRHERRNYCSTICTHERAARDRHIAAYNLH